MNSFADASRLVALRSVGGSPTHLRTLKRRLDNILAEAPQVAGAADRGGFVERAAVDPPVQTVGLESPAWYNKVSRVALLRDRAVNQPAGLCRCPVSTPKRQDDNKRSDRPATQPGTDEALVSVHSSGSFFSW